MLVYWLDVAERNHHLWTGWVCSKARGHYRERPIVVPDLDALPLSARVYLAGMPWRRPI